MTPGAARASLDAFLRKYGQDCTLQRPAVGGPSIDVAVRAHVVDFKPHEIEMGAGIQAGDSRVIISTTEINAAQWPTPSESRTPRKGDRLVLSTGRVRIVQAAWPAPYIGDELVRVEMIIR